MGRGVHDRAHRFPWGTYSETMKWWSPDPAEPTWCRAIHDWEEDYLHSSQEIAERYGVTTRWMRYVYARWDRFRRDRPVMPTVDPLGAIIDIHRRQRLAKDG